MAGASLVAQIGKASACNAWDLGSIPGLGRSPGGGHGNPLQYACLEHSHGQRSLVGYSAWGPRVRHDWATKQSTTTESEEEPKDLLMKVKEESEKAGLKLNIQKMKITTSGPITSWQIDGEKNSWGKVTDFIFFGSKITADSNCIHEIKRHLLLGRKAMMNLDSILKGRDITLLTKVHIVKAMVFPIVMYRCESWTIKKNKECQRIDVFKLWYWKRLFRVLWTARRSN